jgi:CRP-like cAMP-binding protein
MEYNRLLSYLKRVALGEGQILNEADEVISAAYFPNDSVVSLLYGMQDHPTLVLKAVGREGMVGISLVLGYRLASHVTIVQHAGTAMTLTAGALRKNIAPGRRLRHLLFCNIHARLAPVTQYLACDRL